MNTDELFLESTISENKLMSKKVYTDGNVKFIAGFNGSSEYDTLATKYAVTLYGDGSMDASFVIFGDNENSKYRFTAYSTSVLYDESEYDVDSAMKRVNDNLNEIDALIGELVNFRNSYIEASKLIPKTIEEYVNTRSENRAKRLALFNKDSE